MKEFKEKTESGIFIYENPSDFLEAIEELQKLYLASTEGAVEHE